jgi:hypothetical protein
VVDKQEERAVKELDLRIFKDRIEVMGFLFILRKLSVSDEFNLSKLQVLYVNGEWG